MKERLLLLLESEHLSSSKFADLIGVQRSSVSHILSGRNKPSFDFMQKTLKAFPALNADWLILEEGDMYEGTVSSTSNNIFDKTEAGLISEKGEHTLSDASEIENSGDNASNPANISLQDRYRSEKELTNEAESKQEKKRISRVILFYDDNSFTTYEPEA